MANSSENRWLSKDEDFTWRAIWSLMTWLPRKLEAQLREDHGLSLTE